MSRAEKATTAGCLLYLLGILVTYGHAFNDYPDTGEYLGRTLSISSEEKAIGSAFIALVWPLYVSVKVWEKKA